MQGFSLYRLVCTFAILFFVNHSDGQSLQTVDSIKTDHQYCLDHTDFMLGCSYDYFNKADSLLNVVYHKILIRLSKNQREKFRQEQRKWLKKRDSYFNEIRKEESKTSKGVIGNDLKMIIADRQTDFIFERTVELLKKR